MAAVDWFAPAEIAEPRTGAAARRARPGVRRRPYAHGASATQRRVRGHIVWMVVFALLLFGVVAVNVAVLRANVAVSTARPASARNSRRGTRRSLRQLSRGQLRAAHRGGRAPARPRPGVGGQTRSYLDLAPRGR